MARKAKPNPDKIAKNIAGNSATELRGDDNRRVVSHGYSQLPMSRTSAMRDVQSIPSVDVGLSAPRGMSSAVNRDLVSLNVDHSRLPQSPNVRPEDRAPNLFRPAGNTSTRGHGVAADLAHEVNRHQYLFGRVQNPPEPTIAVKRKVGAGRQGGPTQDIGPGSDVAPRDKEGLQAKRQIAAISTPAGLKKGVDGPGARGDFAGEESSRIRTIELGEHRQRLTTTMATTSSVRPPRAEGIQKFRAGEQSSPVSPKMKERMSTVTVSKGEVQTDESGRERLVPKGRRTTMSKAKHTERANKQIAKRKKVETKRDAMLDSISSLPQFDAGLSAESGGRTYDPYTKELY